MNNRRITDLAMKMGRLLEGERVEDAGAAIGVLVGTFVAGFGGKEKQIREGVATIAGNAEDCAIKLYRARN